MKKEFIPYEPARAIKELGFDEECFGYYNIDPSLGKTYLNARCKPIEHEWCLPAPTFSQAFKFFRENYKLFNVVNVKYVNGASYFLRIETPPTNGYQYFDEGFKTYEEAELACLIKMIKIVKNK